LFYAYYLIEQKRRLEQSVFIEKAGTRFRYQRATFFHEVRQRLLFLGGDRKSNRDVKGSQSFGKYSS
jgi:hypothetical protein